MKRLLILLSIIFFINLSCNTAEPPDNRNISLSLEDVSCTEAWLKLTTNNLSFPAEIKIMRTDVDGNSASKISKLNTQDSLLYIDSLLPNQSYTLQGFYTTNNLPQTTNKLTVQTLDTTSDNFTWQKYYFGGAAFSVLHDVAIISDSLIFAVGEIYLNDSTGTVDPTPYCYVKWNGKEWKLGRLKFFPPGAIGDSLNAKGEAIFANNENDIWMTAGAIFHWNGLLWGLTYNTGAEGANKIWCDSKGNCWFVGNKGLIVHNQNGVWSRIVSGTTLDITDIWGSDNPSQVLAVANDLGGATLLRQL